MYPGLEPLEILVRAGTEGDLRQRHDAIELVLGDLLTIEHQHTGQVVA